MEVSQEHPSATLFIQLTACDLLLASLVSLVCCLGGEGEVVGSSSFVEGPQTHPSATLFTQSTATSADLLVSLTVESSCCLGDENAVAVDPFAKDL